MLPLLQPASHLWLLNERFELLLSRPWAVTFVELGYGEEGERLKDRAGSLAAGKVRACRGRPVGVRRGL